MRFPMCQTVAVARHMGRMKKKGIARFPLVLMLEPLHACNLTCAGCGRIREYKDHMSKMLSLDDCLRAVDDCNAPVVSVCGGEPLLYPQIATLVDEILKRGKVVYLCTNGWALEQKIGIFKPNKMFNINVHIDGTKKVHDVIVEREGAFDRAVAGIRAAKKAGINVCTNTTVYAQSETSDVRELVGILKKENVDGILISPGFDYGEVNDQSFFLKREAIKKKFLELDDVVRSKKIWNTPLFYDFLQGKREYDCTPWGNATYNVCGWKAPCYLVTDGHISSYADFISDTEWGKYGPSKDERCTNCMAHCGFEATAALLTTKSVKDMLRMAYWTMF